LILLLCQTKGNQKQDNSTILDIYQNRNKKKIIERERLKRQKQKLFVPDGDPNPLEIQNRPQKKPNTLQFT